MRNRLFVFVLAVLLVLLVICIATVVWLAPWTDSLSSQAASAGNPAEFSYSGQTAPPAPPSARHWARNRSRR